jgi:hypothetical protein
LSGTAAIASEYDGAVEAVQHDVTGWILRGDDPARAADELLALVRDTDRRRRYTDAACAWATRELDLRALSSTRCWTRSAGRHDDESSGWRGSPWPKYSPATMLLRQPIMLPYSVEHRRRPAPRRTFSAVGEIERQYDGREAAVFDVLHERAFVP